MNHFAIKRRFVRRLGICCLTLGMVLTACAGGSNDGGAIEDAADSTADRAGDASAAQPAPAVEPTATPAPEPTATPAPEPTPIYPAGSHLTRLMVDGEQRIFLLHVPAAYSADTAWPLVLNLHPYGTSATQQNEISRMAVKAEEAGFVVVYPQATGAPPVWQFGSADTPSPDPPFILALIDHLRAALNIDPARIYLTGFSNGGGMANELACTLSETFAAVATVGGVYPTALECAPARPVPYLFIHGSADATVPYDDDSRPELWRVPAWAAARAALNGCTADAPEVTATGEAYRVETWCPGPAEVSLATFEGLGHFWPTVDERLGITQLSTEINATDLIWEFFTAHRLP